MPSANLFARAIENMLGGSALAETRQTDYLSDSIKILLTTSAYAPNLDTNEVKADVTNEISGTGYVAGGQALASKTITYTAADSWGTQRANTTAYAVGDVVRPATPNGHLYECVVAGSSAGAPPTFPTVSGQTVADGTVTWAEAGRGVTVVDAADPSWASATFTTRYGVIYNSTPTDQPLLALFDFGGDKSPENGPFTITLSVLGIARFFTR